jgi:hypothetical protein
MKKKKNLFPLSALNQGILSGNSSAAPILLAIERAKNEKDFPEEKMLEGYHRWLGSHIFRPKTGLIHAILPEMRRSIIQAYQELVGDKIHPEVSGYIFTVLEAESTVLKIAS